MDPEDGEEAAAAAGGEEQGGSKGENVKVALRVRPLSTKELGNEEMPCVAINDAGDMITLREEEGKDYQFGFDMIFGSKAEQIQLYHHVGVPALQNTLTGFNGTIFAYGQTGSGKTFCMAGTQDDPGIIPRINKALFNKVHQDHSNPECTRKYLVVISYLEIYNEIIFDLLNPPQDKGKLGGGLQIKEHPVLGIYVKDLQEIVVADDAKLTELMDRGNKSRAVSATLMNATSSRSHSVFTVKVHQKDEEDSSNNVFAKLNLVDLAGSERQKGTGATGQTLKEGANINKSLSALGNVINALVESSGSSKKVFIPYRNSKLTRVLQESLGGNSLCTMLATLSPALCNLEETLSTVRYANRAKQIKVSAKKNEEASQISRLQSEVNELKKLLAAQQASEGGVGGRAMSEEEKKALSEQYENQIMEMNSFMKQTWEEKAKLSRKHEEELSRVQEERKRVAKKMEEERSKRWQLLQEQNDVLLSLRALADAVQPLGAFKEAEGMPDSVSKTLHLLAPSVVTDWRNEVKGLVERIDEIRAQREAVLVFKTAFDTDISHWVDSTEYAVEVHDSVSTTAISRALIKLQRLRQTAEQLVNLTKVTLDQISDLKQAVKVGLDAWNKYGSSAIGFAFPTQDESEDAKDARHAQLKVAEQDVSRGLKLVARQVRQMSLQVIGLGKCDFTEVGGMVVTAAQVDIQKLSELPDVESFIASLQEKVAAVHVLLQPPESAEGDPTSPTQPAENDLANVPLADLSGTSEDAALFIGQVIAWDDLPKTKKAPEELLARPPPKFIYDVVQLVSETTGYLQEIFQDEAFSDWKNLESREAKVNFLTAVAKAVGNSLQVEVLMTAADVLKGVNTDNTNRWFQLLAIGATRVGKSAKRTETDSPEYVDGTLPLVEAVDVVLRDVKACIDHRITLRKNGAPYYGAILCNSTVSFVSIPCSILPFPFRFRFHVQSSPR
jgi:kinesin family protein 1/kinesin family protein 3/17